MPKQSIGNGPESRYLLNAEGLTVNPTLTRFVVETVPIKAIPEHLRAEKFCVPINPARRSKVMQKAPNPLPDSSRQSTPPLPGPSLRSVGQAIRRLLCSAEADVFRYGVSSATDIDQIVQDLGVATLTMRRDDAVDLRADKVWVLTVDMDGQPCDAYISQKNSAVWVNVGGLESGSQGDAVYQIAGAYAYNNSLRFIGDPDGITEAGKRRRLEAISALALKYGTTQFIEPHPDMLGWHGLKWVGNDDDKLGLIARASCDLTEELYPGVKNVDFTGTEFTFEGRAVSTIALDRLVQQWRGQLAGPQREGAPGSGTVRMAALYASFASAPDRGAGPGLCLGERAAGPQTLRACLSGIRA